MKLKSLKIELGTQQEYIVNSNEVTISANNTITFIRGGAFFTSAFAVKNEKGLWCFHLKDHYDRLKTTHSVMFERNDLPFTYEWLRQKVEDILELNKDYTGRLNVQLFLLGGDAFSYGKDEKYSNGFGGKISELLLLIKPLTSKPKWSFEKGVNLLTYKHQRPLADAKPTNYLAAFTQQFSIEAINTWVLANKNGQSLSEKIAEIISIYRGMDPAEQKQFRQDMIAQFEVNESLKSAYNECLPELVHEVLFVSKDDDPYVLEGSTFSLFGFDSENTLRFIPLSGNCEQKIKPNDGKVLKSLSISAIEGIAQESGFKIKKEPIKLTELMTFNQVHVVSATRWGLNYDPIKFQFVQSIDGRPLKTGTPESLSLYNQLREGICAHFKEYTHEDVLQTQH